MSNYSRTFLGCLLIVVIALCASFLVGEWGGGAGRVDLTAGKLFSLSDGSKAIIDGLQKPLTIKFYYSKSAIDREERNELREIHGYYYYVRGLLDGYERYADGRLIVEEYDPRAYSEEEEAADDYKLQRLANFGDDGLYFGMVVVSQSGAEQVIRYFDPGRQSQIEYQISEAIDLATKPPKRRVGVLSSLEITGRGMTPMLRQVLAMQGQAVPEPWGAVDVLRRRYDVEDVSATATDIDQSLDYLMVVHPKDLPSDTLYAIDQFVMHGGKLLVFVDPMALLADPEPEPDPALGQMDRSEHDPSSGLEFLLNKWGCRVPAKVAGDEALAQLVPMAGGRTERLVTYLGLNEGGGEQLPEGEVIVEGLSGPIRLFFPGVVEPVEEVEGVEFFPLLLTTGSGGSMDVDFERMLVQGGVDTPWINRNFESGQRPVVLAARLTGQFQSAFDAATPPTEAAEGDEEVPPRPHLDESIGKGTIVVFADVDILADRLAYMRRGEMVIPLTSNGDLLQNSLDFLAGSTDLMSVRSRGDFERRFTVVDRIEREANERTKEKVDAINAEIEAYQTEISQTMAGYSEEKAGLVKGEALDKRRELERKIREKRRELDREKREEFDEIADLGFRLEIFNYLLVPLLVLLAGVGVWMARWRRRMSVKGGAR